VGARAARAMAPRATARVALGGAGGPRLAAPLAARAYGLKSSVDASGPAKEAQIEDIFGENCFNARQQQRYLAPKVYKEVQRRIDNHEQLSGELAETFAAGLLRWAVERGATHYTHWFHPMTGGSAQKHDSFVTKHGDHVITSFTGKTLSIGEPDASSFPSGGLRETHEARGYTVWDPSSPCFVIQHGETATLYIPCVFFSWKGHAQDEKTPLLAASQALNREGLRLLNAVGAEGHTHLHSDAGVEQEFFLVDRDYAMARPDILQTGRTLIGAAPPKGQALDDHYFGDLTARTMNLINDAEIEMWRLGIAQTTRHKEVAPGQYEIAPVFVPTSVASDNNVLVMETLRRVSHAHGMEVLFHEKPFAGLNGSGKHNNWSVGTNLVGSLFNPGEIPQKNRLFMLFLAATLRAVDTHQDLMRISVASASNDHRLGANEAPPAIISVYLGEDIAIAVDKFLEGDMTPPIEQAKDDLGFSCLPEFKKDPTDRNRTSPFAFTGNKFEFRAVGSSHTPHRSCYILNTILAESCGEMADAIAAATAGKSGDEADAAIDAVIAGTLKDHYRIIFNGNSYSEEWHRHAEEDRGLLNLRTTPEALAMLDTPKNQKLFDKMGVFSPEVLEARSNIWHEEYITKLCTEGTAFCHLVDQRVLPAAVETQEKLAAALASVKEAGGKVGDAQMARLNRLSGLIDAATAGSDEIARLTEAVEEQDGVKAQAAFACNELLAKMFEVREAVDELETLSDSKTWTIPSYHEMLFTGQNYDVQPTGTRV